MTDVKNLADFDQLHVDCNANVPDPCRQLEIKTGAEPASNGKPPSSNHECIKGEGVDHHSNWLTELAIIATSPQSPLMDSGRRKGGAGMGRHRQRHHSEGSVRHKPRLSAAIRSLNRAIHSYAKPPPQSPSPPPTITSSSSSEVHHHDDDDIIDPVGYWAPESDARITSSSPFPASPKETESSGGTWTHQWPTAVWKCFLKGNSVRFTSGTRTDWRLAEEIGGTELLASQANLHLNSPGSGRQSPCSTYAPLGLRLVKIEDPKPTEPRPSRAAPPGSHGDHAEDQMKLTFNPDIKGQPSLEAICSTDHPFFVRDKGWSSYIPCQTVVRYGIPCSELESGDVCLPPSHPDAISFKESDVVESFKSYAFTPLDSSAVLALSSMARHRRDLENSPTRQPPLSPPHFTLSSTNLADRFIIPPEGGGSSSAPSSPVKGVKKLSLEQGDEGKGKRPMNAFMLFAKKFRLEYTQLYPDKDNRAISVILGNKWKRMKQEERKVFSQEAKHLADEHKKIHPNCWKRKRAHSTSSMHHS